MLLHLVDSIYQASILNTFNQPFHLTILLRYNKNRLHLVCRVFLLVWVFNLNPLSLKYKATQLMIRIKIQCQDCLLEWDLRHKIQCQDYLQEWDLLHNKQNHKLSQLLIFSVSLKAWLILIVDKIRCLKQNCQVLQLCNLQPSTIRPQFQLSILCKEWELRL